MKIILSLLLALVFDFTYGATNCTCGQTNKDGNKYPFIAGIYIQDTLACAGVILTKRHILTTMSCMEDFTMKLKYRQLDVIVGDTNIKDGDKVESKDAFKSTVIRLLSPPDYYIVGRLDDLAVLVTQNPIPFNDKISPICLPSGKVDLAGKTLTGVGWGRINTRRLPPFNSADGQNVTVVPTKECIDQNYLIEPNTNVLCIKSKTTDACRSVKGGPLVYWDESTKSHFLGGLACYSRYCEKDFPVHAVDVTPYNQWIQWAISRTETGEKTCTKV